MLTAVVTSTAVNAQDSGTSDSFRVDDLRENQLFDVTLTAAPLTRPALQHRLFPAVDEMLKRNAAPYYHRAIHQMRSIDSGIRTQNQRAENKLPYLYDDPGLWMDSPLADMPVDDMKQWLDRHADFFLELQRAVRSSQCDWGVLPADSENLNAYSLRLDEIQQMRSICRVLVVAIRVAASEKDFDKATELLQRFCLYAMTSACKRVTLN